MALGIAGTPLTAAQTAELLAGLESGQTLTANTVLAWPALAGRYLIGNSATPITITLPNDAGIPDGHPVRGVNRGAGALSFLGTGIVSNAALPTTVAQNMAFEARRIPGGWVVTVFALETQDVQPLPSAPVGTDLTLVFRGGVPYTAALSAIQTLFGVAAPAPSPSPSPSPPPPPPAPAPSSTLVGQTFATGFNGTTAELPSGTLAAHYLTAIVVSSANGEPATMAAPSGWIGSSSFTLPVEGRATRIFTARGDVGTLTFPVTGLAYVLLIATTTPLRAQTLDGSDYSSPTNSTANLLSPAVVAAAGDLGIAAYVQIADNGTSTAMESPGAPQAGWARARFENSSLPRVSVLTRTGLTAGSTGTVSHDANAAFQSRFVATLVFGS